ncbi:MAG: hypothetical protein PHP10_02105 [Candidatus Omnitrophica bacterium]|nr:hypothetical protein [Candidatus Omnitrophota bacterium]
MTAFENWQVCLGIAQAAILLAAFLGALYVGFKQNEINQNLLDLQFSVSLELTYQPQRLNIVNKGQQNIWLCGTKLGDGVRSIDQPVLITPGGSYYLIADMLEREIVSKVGESGEMRLPFEVLIQTQNRKRWIVKTILFAVATKGVVTIHTQTISATPGDWATNAK